MQKLNDIYTEKMKLKIKVSDISDQSFDYYIKLILFSLIKTN